MRWCFILLIFSTTELTTPLFIKTYVESMKRNINHISFDSSKGWYVQQLLDPSQQQTPCSSFSSVGRTGATGWLITISCEVCIKGQLFFPMSLLEIKNSKMWGWNQNLQGTNLDLEDCMYNSKEVNFQILNFHMCFFLDSVSVRISLGSQSSFSHLIHNGILHT